MEKLNSVIKDVTKQLNDFKIGLAAETLYHEFWHWFCDECIEKSKAGQISRPALIKGLVAFLKLLHPFIPFVTETIWQSLIKEKLIKDDQLLALSDWP